MEETLEPKNDPKIHNGFWTDTANLMQIYKKEGNMERYEGLVDARILYSRYSNLNNQYYQNSKSTFLTKIKNFISNLFAD